MRKFAPAGKTGTKATVAITQTAYATASATVAAATAATPAAQTSAALTVADGAGTNDGTIGAITADASVIAAVQELAAQVNKLVADVTELRTQAAANVADVLSVKQNLNSVVDALQARGQLG